MVETQEMRALSIAEANDPAQFSEPVVHTINNRLASIKLQAHLLTRSTSDATAYSKQIEADVAEIHLLIQALHILSTKKRHYAG